MYQAYPYSTLVLLWVLFFGMHSLLASLWVKRAFQKKFPSFYPYYRLIYNLIAVFTLGGVIYYQHTVPDILLYSLPPVLTYFAYVLILLGLLMMVNAFRYYDRGEFLGTRQLKNSEQQDPLITTGMNAWVRHPLYFGAILSLLGYLLISFHLHTLINVLAIFGYLVIGTYWEEQKLIALYGSAYRDYQKRVKMLIPFVF